jgi:hypothetical protein
MSSKDSGFNLKSVVTITKSLIEDLLYFQNENDCLVANFTEGGKYPIVVITGENATGKSFIRRLYQLLFKEYCNIECIHLSQQGRSSSGIIKAFVYGDETWESTGDISGRTVRTGISTCNSRDNKHTIIWDEPDIGLSDSYSAGIGVEIRKFVENLPKLTFGVIVITHSKYLIKELLPLNPHHLRLGDNKSLNSYLKERVKPKDISTLHDRAIETFRKIQSIINEKDKNK